jgi:hypothetical protein
MEYGYKCLPKVKFNFLYTDLCRFLHKVMLKKLHTIIVVGTICFWLQTNYAFAQQGYTLQYNFVEQQQEPSIKLTASFTDFNAAMKYVDGLANQLRMQGFLAASIDSISTAENFATLWVYLGKKYKWINIRSNFLNAEDAKRSGFSASDFNNKAVNFDELQQYKNEWIAYNENNGYPFASAKLDSIEFRTDSVSAVFMFFKNQSYRIDSIQNLGKLKLSKRFLQKYLSIPNGSLYKRSLLQQIDKRMADLAFVEVQRPSTVTLHPKTATVNLHVISKKSSELSAIIGFLPNANNSNKLQVTGDVNVDLKNVFGGGEGLLIKFQALQPESPRVNFGFDKPYVFKSSYGVGGLFELFKKDSSFIQISAQAFVQTNQGLKNTFRLSIQRQSTSVLQGGVDTNQIIQTKQLPDVVDVSATNTALQYEFRNTNYRFNPVKGWEISSNVSVGIKNIKPNSTVTAIKTGGFNYAGLYDSLQLRSYQVRLKAHVNKFLQLSKLSTIKIATQVGWYNSPNIFRNEVFQIGGFKLLRGFDEESIYATAYSVTTAEYRALLDVNSYFFAFVDAGFTQTKYATINATNNFISTGLGIVYQTKAGLLNLSFAIGKRNDVPFALRQASKIHFGYINYF